MIALALIVLLVLSLAGYVAGTLTVAVEAPVSSWERVSQWAERARFYETGPKAGWARTAKDYEGGSWTMPCPCGRMVPCVHGTFADADGVYCDAQCYGRYSSEALNGVAF